MGKTKTFKEQRLYCYFIILHNFVSLFFSYYATNHYFWFQKNVGYFSVQQDQIKLKRYYYFFSCYATYLTNWNITYGLTKMLSIFSVQ